MPRPATADGDIALKNPSRPGRRGSRRQRIERQERRLQAEQAGLPVRPSQATTPDSRGISYSGLFGGALAVGTLLVIAVSFARSDREIWAFVYGPLSAIFVPAVVVSQADSVRRRPVLRASTVAALLVALLSLPLDYGIPFLMAPSTVLLAQGAGYILQGRRGA